MFVIVVGGGRVGFYLTVALALVATASGVIASIFAVSRMLAMLTDMKLIPHSHFGMPGTIRDHTLVYTVVIAGALVFSKEAPDILLADGRTQGSFVASNHILRFHPSSGTTR